MTPPKLREGEGIAPTPGVAVEEDGGVAEAMAERRAEGDNEQFPIVSAASTAASIAFSMAASMAVDAALAARASLAAASATSRAAISLFAAAAAAALAADTAADAAAAPPAVPIPVPSSPLCTLPKLVLGDVPVSRIRMTRPSPAPNSVWPRVLTLGISPAPSPGTAAAAATAVVTTLVADPIDPTDS